MNTVLGRDAHADAEGQDPHRKRRLSIVRRVLAPLNLALIVVMGLSIAWDYNRMWKSHFQTAKAELEAEANFVLSVVERFRGEGLPSTREVEEEFCTAMTEALPPGHVIAVRIAGEDFPKQGGLPPSGMVTSMDRAVDTASGLAHPDEDSIIVGIAAKNDVIVYVSQELSTLTSALRPRLSRRMAGILMVGFVLAVILNLVLHRSLLRPLRDMVRVVHQLGRGKWSARMADSRTKELGLLGDEFNLMASELEKAEIRRRGRMKRARRIQTNLLPGMSSLPGGSWVSAFEPADEVGGDYFDVLPLSDKSVLLCVADVAGHGVPGAMVAAMLKVLLQAGVRQQGGPAQLLHALNAALCRTIPSEGFATMLLARIDLKERALTCVSAGHERAYLLRGDRPTVFLESTGTVLGVRAEAKWETQELSLSAGDRLVAVTDGIPQTVSPAGEIFGQDRLLAMLEAGRTDSLAVLRDRVVKAVVSHRGPAPQNDDMAFLAVEF